MMTRQEEMIDDAQIEKFNALKKAIGSPEEYYRECLFRNFGVNAVEAITYKEAEAVINTLVKKAIEWGVWDKFTDKERMITKKQINKIHALKNAMGWDEHGYRATLLYNYGVRTSKDMTWKQADEFSNFLEEKAIKRGVWKKFNGKERFEELKNRPNMATPPQLRMIEAMWKDVSSAGNEKQRREALRGFLRKYFKVSDLRFLDRGTVGKVITALKNMQSRKTPESTNRHSAAISGSMG
ncbi:MAG: regulatory protein GemA [Nitrospinae bacterium]|nr:regulatory protein GemA [Nitrospinota bacterium]